MSDTSNNYVINSSDLFDHLPEEMIIHIVSYLNLDDKLRLGEINKHFFDIVVNTLDNDPNTIMEAAARLGLLHIFKYFATERTRNNNICALAASGGHLDILKHARFLKFPWDSDACTGAARNGHLDVLKFLRSGPDKCPWNFFMCRAAARKYLEVLKFLRFRADKCPSSGVCRAPLTNGNLEVLRFLLSDSYNVLITSPYSKSSIISLVKTLR
jgi:hypothetical protein